MDRDVLFIVVGVVIIVVGLVASAAIPYSALVDPVDLAVLTVEVEAEESVDVPLEEGRWQLWSTNRTWNGAVEILDEGDGSMFRGPTGSTIYMVRDRTLVGDVEVGSSGTYNMTAFGAGGTFVFPEPQDVRWSSGGTCGGLLVSLLGALLVIVGGIRAWEARKAPFDPRSRPPPPCQPQGQEGPSPYGETPDEGSCDDREA